MRSSVDMLEENCGETQSFAFNRFGTLSFTGKCNRFYSNYTENINDNNNLLQYQFMNDFTHV